MSTAYSSAKQQYIGNGVTTEWGFDFPIKKHSELKVYLKRSEHPQVLLEEGVDYSFVTENTIAFPIKAGEAKLQAADVLALQRESVFESEYNFSNQQRLEPEEVMHSDDNLERQIQELKRDVTQAIRIQPTSNIDTDEYFVAVESIYENLDNINNVSGISAEIVNCSDNISDISAVSSNIANVNAVGQSISDVNTVASNVSSVNTVAGVSTDVTAVAGISTDVSTVANNSANITTVATNISDVNTAATNIEAIKEATTSATNAAQSAANAANSATDSANSATASATSANNSHIWAEGTDAQVQALGGVHSSKGWAEQSTNANIALTNSPYTTNRILEIPQDIKLELNNGILTLKAGSKVYVPNGPDVFDEVVISADKTLGKIGSYTGSSLLLVRADGSRIVQSVEHMSGSTAPTTSSGMWYDTTNNKIFSYTNGTVDTVQYSLPVALVSRTNGSWTSIDQVFNGFGYIGSTVFVLPGVKVQIPNGRNADGTYKSGVITSNSVATRTATGGASDKWIIFNGSNVYLNSKTNEIFDADSNCWKYDGTKQADIGCLGGAYFDGTKISSFTPYNVDSVVNSNEFYQLKDKTVTTDTNQTISGSKRFTQPSGGMSIELVADTNQQTVPTTTTVRQLGLYRNSTYTKGDGFTSWLQAVRRSDGWTTTEMYARRFLESDSQEIVNYLKAGITPDGISVSYTKTPPVGVTGEEIVTAGWFNSKMQVVSALPAAPDANVFYFIPE